MVYFKKENKEARRPLPHKSSVLTIKLLLYCATYFTTEKNKLRLRDGLVFDPPTEL